MNPVSGFGLVHLAVVAIAALTVGAVGGWMLEARRARTRLRAEVDDWERRHRAALGEIEGLGRQSAQLTDALKATRSKLGTAEVGQRAAQAALEARTEDLAQAREALRRAQAARTHSELELDELAARSADAGPLREALAERESSVERSESRARALAARVQDLTAARSKLESEVMRLAVRVESLEHELQQATQTSRRELETHRQALGAANALVEQSRREHARLTDRLATVTKELETADRALGQFREQAVEIEAEVRNKSAARIARELELSQAVADREAAIGSLEAKAERIDPLVRRLEDRESLLRAVLFERDEAARQLADLERQAATSAEALAAETARRHRTEARIAELEAQVGQADRRAAIALRERDAAQAVASRAEVEIATVRGELRERDRRFRVLAEESQRQLREMETRVLELESEMMASSSILADGTLPVGNGIPLGVDPGPQSPPATFGERLDAREPPPDGQPLGEANPSTASPDPGDASPEPDWGADPDPPTRPAATTPGEPDDLTLIRGIGPVLAARLIERGVTRLEQIAAWTAEDIEEIGRALGAFPDRIRRDRWVEGAREVLEQRAGSA